MRFVKPSFHVGVYAHCTIIRLIFKLKKHCKSQSFIFQVFFFPLTLLNPSIIYQTDPTLPFVFDLLRFVFDNLKLYNVRECGFYLKMSSRKFNYQLFLTFFVSLFLICIFPVGPDINVLLFNLINYNYLLRNMKSFLEKGRIVKLG